MQCHRQRVSPCSPIDLCSVSAHFALSPLSPASISVAVSPPRAQNATVWIVCDRIDAQLWLFEFFDIIKTGSVQVL